MPTPTPEMMQQLVPCPWCGTLIRRDGKWVYCSRVCLDAALVNRALDSEGFSQSAARTDHVHPKVKP